MQCGRRQTQYLRKLCKGAFPPFLAQKTAELSFKRVVRGAILPKNPFLLWNIFRVELHPPRRAISASETRRAPDSFRKMRRFAEPPLSERGFETISGKSSLISSCPSVFIIACSRQALEQAAVQDGLYSFWPNHAV